MRRVCDSVWLAAVIVYFSYQSLRALILVRTGGVSFPAFWTTCLPKRIAGYPRVTPRVLYGWRRLSGGI
eukprot:scaffold73818_cov37-Attheya_sp.AAC.1